MPSSLPALPRNFLSPDGQRLTWRAYVILVLLCLAYFLPGFTSLPPVDRDEPRFAQATKQMIETGNYVDIRFQKETRYKKPIGIYWLQAASVKLLSPDDLTAIWAYRVPSLIGATTAVLMTAAVGDLMFGPLTGLLAALLMAASLVLNVEARLAKTDAMLLACIMVSQYALARAYMSRDKQKRQSWPLCAAFWTAQGAGFLIKGPILLFVTLSTLLGLRLYDKKLGWFKSLRPSIGLPYALLLAAPWFVIIMLASNGEFAAQSAGHDFLAKIWQGQDRGRLPPGLHFLALPLVFFPGSILALLALPDAWKARKDSRVLFCLSWIIPLWAVFELSMTKLPHYVLPVYPAIAMLAAHMALKNFPALAGKRLSWYRHTVFGLWCLAGLILAATLVGFPYRIEGAISRSGLIAAGIVLTTVAGFITMYKRRSPYRYVVLVGVNLLMIAVGFGVLSPNLGSIWLSRQIVQVAGRIKPCERLSLATAGYNEPSLIFLAGTETNDTNSGEETARLMKESSCTLGLVSKNQEQTFTAWFNADPVKPVPVAEFSGLNIGSGHFTYLTLYRFPSPGQSTP